MCFFQKHNVNLHHIESRSSTRYEDRYEFKIECSSRDEKGLDAALEALKDRCEYFNVISRNHTNNDG